MIRSILLVVLLGGLVGCAQAGKKADAPADPKTSENKATSSAATDTKTSAEAKAPAKDTKASGKDDKASKGKEAKSKAEPKSSPAPAGMGVVTCESGSVKRVITVKGVDKGCEVLYEKDGATKVEGTGKNGLDNCNRIQEKIKTNLTNAGYKCN